MERTRSKEEEDIRELVRGMHEFQMEQIPPEETLKETCHLSDLFYRRMEELFRKQEKKAKRRRRMRSFGAAAAVFLVLLYIMRPQYFAEAARWVMRWFDDHVEFRFQEDSGVNWIPRYTMGYVPEGYHIEMDEYDGIGAGVMECYNEERLCISFVYCTVDGLMDMDNENKELLILETEDKTKIYYLKARNEDENSFMTWVSKDGTAVLSIDGVLPEEELLKIQQNIVIKNN